MPVEYLDIATSDGMLEAVMSAAWGEAFEHKAQEQKRRRRQARGKERQAKPTTRKVQGVGYGRATFTAAA